MPTMTDFRDNFVHDLAFSRSIYALFKGLNDSPQDIPAGLFL
jgi:hypothetical protein